MLEGKDGIKKRHKKRHKSRSKEQCEVNHVENEKKSNVVSAVDGGIKRQLDDGSCLHVPNRQV